jgi:hypothetical protein
MKAEYTFDYLDSDLVLFDLFIELQELDLCTGKARRFHSRRRGEVEFGTCTRYICWWNMMAMSSPLWACGGL